MSLLSGLDSHEQNPATKWGRYSDYSEPSPENDEVCLVTLSPQLNVKRSSTRRQTRHRVAIAPQLIEIKDDKICAKLRSNTDKNPKSFSAMATNYTIPKTKQQTANSKSKTFPLNNGSEKGLWMSTSRSSQLPLVQSALSGATKRKDINNDKRPKKVLRQTVDCSETPKTSDTRNPLSSGQNQQARSTHSKETPKSQTVECEEVRCHLCNDVITTGRCFTCPWSTSEEEFESSVIENSNKQDLLALPEDAASSRKTDRAEGNCKWKNTESLVQDDLPVSSESHDDEFHDSDDFIETSPPLKASSKTNMTQNDLFCELCGKGKSKSGCSCSKSGHSTASFYRRYNKKQSREYCGIKYGGVNKFTTKVKGSVLNSKKKVKNNKVDSKQATIDNLGNTIVDSKKGRKKKGVKPKEPALVHISSDEDETNTDVGANVGSDSNEEIHDKRLAEETKKLKETLQVGAARRNSNKMTKNSLFTSELESTSKQLNGIWTKQSSKRQKKLDQKVNMFKHDDDVLFTVDQVAVGTLCGKAMMTVEVLEGRIIIRMNSGDEVFEFRLQKDDLTFLKIHNECDPWILIIKPNPGWARKYYERYKSHGVFIDPGSDVYSQKHIILVLSEKLTEVAVEKLVGLVDQNFSGEPVEVKITYNKALEWKTVIDGIVEKMEKKPSCPSTPKDSTSNDHCNNSAIKKSTFELSSSTTYKNAGSQNSLSSIDSQETKKRAVPITKTYSTRSKSTAMIESPPRSPARKILDYQPSNRKLDGVRITNEDLRCLEPDIYLNDVIIDFYIKYIIEERLSIVDRERIHIFGSYFYKVLTRKIDDQQRSPANMHARAKSWTKNVDIFSKDFIVIPVNENSHWFLVIICYPRMVAEQSGETETQNNEEDTLSLDTTQEASEEPTAESDDEEFDKSLIDIARKSSKKLNRKKRCQNEGPLKARPCILIFDSLGGSRRNGVVSNFRNYLNYEWKERRNDSVEVSFNKDTLKAGYPKIPYQENYTDCGLYVLQYFEKFFTKPVGDYRFPIDLRDNWFSQDEMKTKRDEIVGVIYDLQAKAESGEIR